MIDLEQISISLLNAFTLNVGIKISMKNKMFSEYIDIIFKNKANCYFFIVPEVQESGLSSRITR